MEYNSGRGFAKGRPAAARRPSPDFPQFFCPAVNPRACTDLHQGLNSVTILIII